MKLLSFGKHKFTLSTGGGAGTVILLDETQFPETFTINYRKRFIEHEFISLDITNKVIEVEREFIGWDIYFALDYSTSANVELMEKIGWIEDLLSDNTMDIKFKVRENDNTFELDVISMTDDLMLRLLYGDEAYEGVKLYFRSKVTQKLLGWINQSGAQYAVFSHTRFFGTNA
jgi:hypothetical protein